MLLEEDSVVSAFTVEQLEESQRHIFNAALEDSLPGNIKGASVVVRSGRIHMGGLQAVVPKLTLDTGASSASYIGSALRSISLEGWFAVHADIELDWQMVLHRWILRSRSLYLCRCLMLTTYYQNQFGRNSMLYLAWAKKSSLDSRTF